MKKINSFWVGTAAYLLVVLGPPALKMAGILACGWLLATCLLWGPALLLAACIVLGLLFKAGAGHAAHE